MTVMGVGELSALNAIAGAFAEYVPIVHIIGKPSREAQKKELCVHHSLGDGQFDTFEEMSHKVSCLTVSIDDAQTAPALIEEAIRTCWIQSRPVSIYIPCDMFRLPIPCHSLRKQPVLDRQFPLDNVRAFEQLIDTATKEIRQATNPVILVGGYGIQNGAKQELEYFLDQVHFPVFAASSGLGIVDSRLPHYVGLYVGSCSSPQALETMDSADLVISIGNIQSDLSTSGFSGVVNQTKLIEIERTKSKVKGQAFEAVHVGSVLKVLALHLRKYPPPPVRSVCADTDTSEHNGSPRSITAIETSVACTGQETMIKSGLRLLTSLRSTVNPFGYFWPNVADEADHVAEKSDLITHDWLWKSLGKWLRAGDVVLTETGTSSFGIWDTTMPPNSIFMAQYLWSSIGYTVGACQGAAQAVRDSTDAKRRTILFIGDGSLQCGCQELSTIIRRGLKPIM